MHSTTYRELEGDSHEGINSTHYISITFISILSTLIFGISFISHRSSSISSNVSPIELSGCLFCVITLRI